MKKLAVMLLALVVMGQIAVVFAGYASDLLASSDKMSATNTSITSIFSIDNLTMVEREASMASRLGR